MVNKSEKVQTQDFIDNICRSYNIQLLTLFSICLGMMLESILYDLDIFPLLSLGKMLMMGEQFTLHKLIELFKNFLIKPGINFAFTIFSNCSIKYT